MNLDYRLREALKRKDPPDGFHDRVLAKVASGAKTRHRPGWHRLGAPLAASLLIVVAGTFYVEQRERRQAEEQRDRTEHDARDVVRALQVASEAVEAVQIRLQEVNQHER